MKARSVARELALFALFQLEKKGEKLQLEKASLQEIITETVRSLADMAYEQIETVSHEIADLRDYLIDYEIQHPTNEYVPLESPTKPVPIPTTQEMVEKLEKLLAAVENLQEALILPEVNALATREEVRNYCLMLVRHVVAHQATIDKLIDEASTEWRVERLQKMDLMLLRLAVAELRSMDNVEAATVIDETMELAKRFTAEESRKFIHGILGSIASKITEVAENV